MKNRISKLIPFAVILIAIVSGALSGSFIGSELRTMISAPMVSTSMAPTSGVVESDQTKKRVTFHKSSPTAAPQEPPEIQAVAPTARLTYWIANVPPEIEAIAESLGVERIGFVPPRYYTRRVDGIPTFNRERAKQNFDAIKAICDGATWIISDIENEHRARVRHPDDYSEAEVETSVAQYVACWSWFRSHWPKGLIFEWNLTNARKPGVGKFAEQLVLKHLDGFAISAFWKDRRKWHELVEGSVTHANALVADTDKIVIVGIHERYKIRREDGVVEFAPVPRSGVDAMIEIALGGDVVFFWSNTYRILASNSSKWVLTEILNDAVEPLPEINAHVVRALAEMQLREESPGPIDANVEISAFGSIDAETAHVIELARSVILEEKTP